MPAFPDPLDNANPFLPKRPMLMDISRAKPSGEVNWDAIVASTQRGKVDQTKKVYDTTKYLAQTREEDPWPEDGTAVEVPMTLSNCRFKEPAPLDLIEPITVLCDVKSDASLPDSDCSVEFRLFAIFRENQKDNEEPQGQPIVVRLNASTSQTPEATFNVSDLLNAQTEPGAEIFLRAEARHVRKQLKAQNKPFPTIAGPTSIHRFRFSGRLFDPGRSFLLPEAIPLVQKVTAYHREHPQDALILVGRSSEQKTDLDLLESRVKSLEAFLSNRTDVWMDAFGPGRKGKDQWSLREWQLILKSLGFKDPSLSGRMEETTSRAIQSFQKSAKPKEGGKLSPSGKMDAPTAKELLRAYFGQEGTTVGKSAKVDQFTLQASIPDSKPVMAGTEEWIECMFFSPRVAPKAKGTLERSVYAKWLESVAGTVELETLGLNVQMLDGDHRALPNRKVVLKGPKEVETISDPQGWIGFVGLERGTYKMEVWRDSVRESIISMEVPSRSTVATKVLPARSHTEGTKQ